MPQGEIFITSTDASGNARTHSEVMRTFIHEIIHAIDKIYCMDNLGAKINKETITDALAEGFVQVILDNPLIFTTISEGEPA